MMARATRWILLTAAVAAAFTAGVWKGRSGKEAGAGRKILHWVDPMHPAYRSDKPGIAPDCGMQLEPVYADGAGPTSAGTSREADMPFGTVKVSPERQQQIGVRVAVVERAPASRTLRLLGRVVPDESRIYRVTAANDWYAKTVSSFTTGSAVRKGDLLATIYPPGDLVPLIQGYLARLETSSRVPVGAVPMEQLRLGQWNIETFRNSLRTQGLWDRQIDEIAKMRMIPEGIDIRTPVSGIILARDIAPEQRADKGAELYRIADLSRVWILGDLFGVDAQAAKAGLPAKVTLPDQGRIFHGRVSQVRPVFDGTTRTLKLRVEVDNPGDVLRPDMFADVEIPVEARSALAVPMDAVLDSGLRKTVFVDRGNGHFEPRQVETGARFGARVEVVRGLMEGERIVVSGNFLLDSESRMRAASLGIQGTPGRCVVCDMDIDVERTKAAGRTAEYRGRTYHFCSDACQREFQVAPERHTGRGASPVGAGEMPAAAKSQTKMAAGRMKTPVAAGAKATDMPMADGGGSPDSTREPAGEAEEMTSDMPADKEPRRMEIPMYMQRIGGDHR